MSHILIQNFHPANTAALVRDFKALGIEVYMPIDNWGGMIQYYFSNHDMGGKLITHQQWKDMPPGDVLIGCYEQQDNFEEIAKNHGDRIILHTAGNNVPYRHGFQYLISPDIQTFNNYPAEHKMLYFYRPIVNYFKKDLKYSFERGDIAAYIHYYKKYWAESYRLASDFKSKWHGKTNFFGYECEDGILNHKDAHFHMVQSFLTLYFKEKDCYGNTVLESMALGTPVLAYGPFIGDKTLGIFFLNDKNSIIVNSVDEAIERIGKLILEEYTSLSENAIITVKELTEDSKRLNQLRALLYG